MINYDFNDDGLDLKPIFRTLWKSRRFIVYGTGLLTMFGAVYVLRIPKIYRSQGFYQAKMAPAVYKTTANVFTDIDRFIRFLSERKVLDDASLQSLKNSITDSDEIAKSFVPSFENSGKDAVASNLLGLDLSWDANSPAMAQKMVAVLADFFRDSLLYNSMHDYISGRYIEAADSLNALKNLILENAFEQRQLTSSKADLQLIRKEYPTAAVEIKQVFSAKGGDSYQYLSPGTEVIKAEVAIADLKRKGIKLERDLEITQMKYDLFSKANELLKANSPTGELLFKQFVSLKNNFFKSRDLSKDTVQEFQATLPENLETLNKALLSNININEMYFISGPNYPYQRLPRGGMRILVGTFCVSFIVFILLALLLDWWRHNNTAILDEDLGVGHPQPSATNGTGQIDAKPKTIVPA